METQITQSEQESIQQIYNFAANLMVREQRTAYDVREILVQKGLSEEAAAQIVETLEEQIASAKKSRARKDVLYGALWCFGGILITAVTYANARGGGSYVVTWGAIIFGGIQLIRGLNAMAD